MMDTQRAQPRPVRLLLICSLLFLFLGWLLYRLVDPGRGLPQYRSIKARADITGLKNALGTYKLDNGNFPTTEQGLRALRVKPADAPKWVGPYADIIVKDPWGHDYVYKFPGDHGEFPDIISYGADGVPGGDGINADIVSWKF